MSGRIHVDPVRRRSTGTRIDTTQTHARIRPAQLKQAVAFYEGKAVDVLHLAGWKRGYGRVAIPSKP
jgi:hypothetical protein